MRPRSFAALVLLSWSGSTYAQAVPKAREADRFEQPDHLVPLRPEVNRWHPDVEKKAMRQVEKKRIEYTKTLVKKLKPPYQPEDAVMLFKPSFEAEHCLVVHLASSGKRPEWTVIHTFANQSIWDSSYEADEDRKAKPLKIKRREVPIPPELAGRICAVWNRMLRGVRYPDPEDDEPGSDGDVIEFWINCMYGRTWSPRGGSPKLLVDLGGSLMEYSKASEEKRSEVLKQVEERCAALEKYLNAK